MPIDFERFSKIKALIIGDVMIDSYYFGKVDRISPEAPVPIVAVGKKESRLGGAANVALNIQAMGAIPILCSVIGTDSEGDTFIDLLDQAQIGSEGIVRSSKRITTEKTRIISNNHQMLRVDHETEENLNTEENDRLLERVAQLLEQVQVLIFEDYDKGVLDAELISKIITLANQKGIPVVVDPKKKNFKAYHRANLFKPNLKELREGLKLDTDLNVLEHLKSAVSQLQDEMGLEAVMVTLSEAGVYIADQQEQVKVDAHVRSISDVSGAGDTVVSVAALCLALGLSKKEIAELSNLAGGLVCEKVGVVPVDKAHLKAEAERIGL